MRLSRFARSAPRHGEEGQVLLLSSLILTVLIGFSAVAIDVGIWMHTRTELQADADAMAIAGAQRLCGTSTCDITAESTALSYASENGLSVSEVQSITAGVSCSGAATANHDWITVRVRRDKPSFLSKILGVGDADISACATAGKYALGGFDGVVPFGIEDDCLNGGIFGTSYTLKYDSKFSDAAAAGCDASRGNFGALAVDEHGAGSGCNSGPSDPDELKFRQALCFGAKRELCSETSPDCEGEADDNVCSGSKPTDTQSCTETGNIAGPTEDGIAYRLANTSASCDQWSEVALTGGQGLTYECNPWIAGGPASLQVIMLPIVDGLWTEGGSHKVDIVGFAIFFLEGAATCGNVPGGEKHCDITGRFIKTQMSTGATGTNSLNANSLITFAKLIN